MSDKIKPAPAAPAASTDQAEQVSQPTPATKPAIRQDGLQIDGFGLPVNRIARIRVLAELAADEPADGEPWDRAAEARKLTETFYG